jgi:hypothetical protein
MIDFKEKANLIWGVADLLRGKRLWGQACDIAILCHQ